MTPKKFAYFAPASLKEAIQLLRENEDAKVLAGGQSLIALMKLRLAAPAALVDITKTGDLLSYIREGKNDNLEVGALTTHDTLERSKIINKKFPILSDAASKIGDQQIRNRGTIGGSCCHADPAADLPTALTALEPEFAVRGVKGKRVIPQSEFFVDTFTTSIAKDEILTEIRIPHTPPKSGSAYIKHSRREGDFAIVGVGAVVTVGPKGVCRDVRVSLGAVAPTPIRAKSAERHLKGKTLDEGNIAEAAERANEEADPPSDMHGSRQYRLDMIRVFARRALNLALSRAR
ncbi:MAG: xanthine dehydrogenase family protein subunit M [Thaumarchaeota archaeon]|nr:MAG: xanthine dehydrogenase family protein subunit M [Nitrososphaerota archaeon]